MDARVQVVIAAAGSGMRGLARGYWKTATMAAASALSDGPLLIADYLLRFLRVVVLLSLWRVLFADRGAVGGLSLATVLTYTLIAEIFADQLAPRANLDDALWNGSIATRALRPNGLVGGFAAEMIGRWWLGLALCSLPLLLLAPLLGVDPRPAGPTALALFGPSLALAVTVGLALEFILGALMVALDLNPWTLTQISIAVTALLSGAVVPLPLFPWGLGAVVAWLPFAALAAAPLQVYTGVGDPRLLLAIQAGWAVLLWPLAGWLWRANREKVTVYGG
jgi:ABC-2 type transport system permease protein